MYFKYRLSNVIKIIIITDLITYLFYNNSYFNSHYIIAIMQFKYNYENVNL